MLKNSLTAALFSFIALGAGSVFIAGCGGGAPSIVGTWSSTSTAEPHLKVSWSMKFGEDGKFNQNLVITDTATTGTGAGCVNTVVMSGKYSVLEKNLTLIAESGTSTYTSCTNSNQNTPAMPFPASNLAEFSGDLSGPFTVTEEQLTLKMPAQDPKPGVLVRQS